MDGFGIKHLLEREVSLEDEPVNESITYERVLFGSDSFLILQQWPYL